MNRIQLDPWQIEYTARALNPHLWDGNLAIHLGRSPMFTPEQARESVERLQQEKIQEVKTCLEAFLAVLDEHRPEVNDV